MGLCAMGMTLKPFTRGFEDRSDEGGYRFVFKCDICNAEYISRYIEASSNKKRDFIGISSRAFSLGSSILDRVSGSGLKDTDEKQREFTDKLADRFKSYAPEWHRGHDDAFFRSQEEAKKNFHYCPLCKRWVCEPDWDEEKSICKEDSKLEVCPNCRKPTGGKKFCINCGLRLEQNCKKCGAALAHGQKFCGECGAKLESA